MELVADKDKDTKINSDFLERLTLKIAGCHGKIYLHRDLLSTQDE